MLYRTAGIGPKGIGPAGTGTSKEGAAGFDGAAEVLSTLFLSI